MIPDEAVEAAARVFIEVDPLWPDGAWEDMADEQRENARGIVAAVLEAAAPHLLAQGWDEGVAYVFEGGAEVADEGEQMNIPDEAVEAVARRNYEAEWGDGWDGVIPNIKRGWLNEARAQCEAAAPHLTKDAYERGWGAGFRHHKEWAK